MAAKLVAQAGEGYVLIKKIPKDSLSDFTFSKPIEAVSVKKITDYEPKKTIFILIESLTDTIKETTRSYDYIVLQDILTLDIIFLKTYFFTTEYFEVESRLKNTASKSNNSKIISKLQTYFLNNTSPTLPSHIGGKRKRSVTKKRVSYRRRTARR
jgi:hypothetical protein